MIKKTALHFWPAILVSVIIWLAVGWQLGISALVITFLLSILEITLSADNAVVNSRVLVKMSPFWQRLFLTVGIIIAVFVIRFILPIEVVALMTPLNSFDVIKLAIDNPDQYSHYLHEISPLINAFGGMFLFHVAMFFFMEKPRENKWLSIEKYIQKLGNIPSLRYIIALLLITPTYFIIEPASRDKIVLALIVGALTYLVLHSITLLMERINKKNQIAKQVGFTAFISFLYLETLDASFSLDGVVGAFALTNNIIIIMAGLGIGALWVRTMTIYLVRHQTLSTFKYLESGAHWAIACLSLIMFLKLASVEVSEILIGFIGLIFIVLSVLSYIKQNKKQVQSAKK